MLSSTVLSFSALTLAALIPAQDVPSFQFGSRNPNASGVRARGSNGPTNPDSPSLDTPINQTSLSRLASVNSIDDWCTFGPHITGQPIGNIEPDVVAWCTKPRNNARVIPDGTLTAVHFVQTPLYVQVMALGDFTNIMVMDGDDGGELDPHGPNGLGNPVGGNVTSNVSGEDVFYEEWMNFLSYNQVCIRICTAAGDVDQYPESRTERVCEHEYDVMGCQWVMPGDYTDNAFDSCDADTAYPPGLYPQGDGSTSRFQQYFSSVYTDPQNGALYTFVNGTPDQATPPAAYSRPASSNCQSASSPSNGIASLAAAVVPSSSSGSSSTTSTGTGTSSAGSMTRSSSTINPTRSNTSNNSGSDSSDDTSDASRMSILGSVLALSALVAGASAIF